MKNVYNIKYEEGLSFILSDNTGIPEKKITKYNNVAIVLYLYYLDTLYRYYRYIDHANSFGNVYIVTSSHLVYNKIKQYIDDNNLENVEVIIKPNVGRDISGLLIAVKEIVLNNEFVCFVHDKKEHTQEMKADTDLWIENIWGNLICSKEYMKHVIEKFTQDKELGVLVPPAPIGEHFCTWYGYGWHGSFEATRQLAERLKLECDLQESMPPITIGTALWFRTKALEKLFTYPWSYNDFDDTQLVNPVYLSYGVERIFAYVAQDAGYKTGEIMSVNYATKQNLFLQYSLTEIFKNVQPFFPFPTLYGVRKLKGNLNRLLDYINNSENIYLYGAGDVGKFCLSILRQNKYEPKAFLLSDRGTLTLVENVPVISINEFTEKGEDRIIVTVVNKKTQSEIEKALIEKGINNYFLFWD